MEKIIYDKIDKAYVNTLPQVLFDGRVIVVNTAGEAEKAVEYLLDQSILGVDTETRPSFKKGQYNRVALLQVSTYDTCFLFRLNLMGITPALKQLLEDTRVPKIGLSLHDDILSLHKREAFQPGNFIDLQKHIGELGVADLSLQKIYANLFHQKISKNARLSNWEADTLTERQKLYAATDAWACIMIYDELQRLETSGDYHLVKHDELEKKRSMYKNIYLKKGKDESLKRFHPWVFSGAISNYDEAIDEGDIVCVINAGGQYIATGHWQVGSIAVRVLSFTDETIDDAFWNRRLGAALKMRQSIGMADNPKNNTYRLVHGEGDNLPGLVIDCYGKTAVMQAHSVGMHCCREAIARQLMEVMDGRIENVFYKSETTLPFKADLGQENGFLYGGSDDNVAIENGLKFHVDWLRGQKTGFFVDQRENRSLLEKYACGKTVLNMFCYTGGFSFYAMRGQAKLVHSVDSSAKAIELTNANVNLNFPNDPRHASFCEDAFKFLDAAKDKYDLIVLDPPAFAKHRAALHNALKGYTRLNVKALEKIKKGGLLFTFSCSQVVTKDNFRNAVFTAAALSGRNVRILHQLHQPADHPINIYHPEGEYLKGLVLYVE